MTYDFQDLLPTVYGKTIDLSKRKIVPLWGIAILALLGCCLADGSAGVKTEALRGVSQS